MLLFLLVLITLQCANSLLFDKPAKLSTPFVVKRDGYPLENHTVTTTDGYVLTLFRIPPTSGSKKSTRVVLLMHGLLSSSLNWVLYGPQQALGYVLSDAGYDVWLGNSRGTRYSKSNIYKDPKSSDFWNFSWHEMGVYDLPSIVEYILNSTGAENLHYVGHSQGATEFLIACSSFKTFNKLFRSAHLMAPGVFLSHSKTLHPLTSTLPILGPIENLFGYFEIAASTRIKELQNELFCQSSALTQPICKNFVFDTVGKSPYMNTTMLPEIVTSHQCGSSIKQISHYLQLSQSGRFQQYDYGLTQNLKLYNNSRPSEYAIENITVDTYFYYCDNDALVDSQDVEYLSSVYPNSSLKRSLLLPFPGCSHFDFIVGINVTAYVSEQILNTLRNYE